ncbi:MAG: M36 family metallopeptidase [Bacteroidota bacterium]
MLQSFRSFMLMALMLCFLPAGAQMEALYIEELLRANNLNSSPDSWEIISHHVSSTSQTTHIYYRQQIAGIPLKGTESSVHLTSTGAILAAHDRFLPSSMSIMAGNAIPTLDPLEAIQRAISWNDYRPQKSFLPVASSDLPSNIHMFSDGGISMRAIPVQLMFVVDDEEKLRLVWEVAVLENDYKHHMLTRVDAHTGEVIYTKDILQRCSMEGDTFIEHLDNPSINEISISSELDDDETICEVCYEVFASPSESPYSGDRTIVQNPADPVASPFGWHDTDGQPGSDSFKTEGNNTFVVEMGDNHGYQSSGGELLDFTEFSFNPIYTIENQSEDAALTNVFYWNNLVHDITFHYGFDEYSGNFQKINYYADTPNRSEMEARVQTRIGCNAYFIAGTSGRERLIMAMGVCEDRDSSFDNKIIVHEYMHGIVYRLIGSAVGGCIGNDERMTEGWCDWLGLMLTIEPTHDRNTRRPFGNFFFGQAPGHRGIRRYPYSADFSKNPQTYADITEASVPHGVGAIWGNMIWEMSWDLIDAFGYDTDLTNFTGDATQDAGNIMAIAIVLEAMKLMSCEPGFIDARDAILMANRSIYGWENECIIYNAFARRGLGLNAEQGLSTSSEDGMEDFTPYPGAAQFSEMQPVCWNNGLVEGLEGGLPFGGIYSGDGVIDDGNGISFSIDTSISGIGSLEITYTVKETSCVTASTATTTVEVYRDDVAPEIDCPEDISVEIPVGEQFSLPSFSGLAVVSDNCMTEVTVSQDPEPFTLLGAGDHVIRLSATDQAGNTNHCEFLYSLLEIGDMSLDFKEVVQLFPLPAGDEVSIYNPDASRIELVFIYDISGKLLGEVTIDRKEVYIPMDVSAYASGNYFFVIQGESDTVVRRMTKL